MEINEKKNIVFISTFAPPYGGVTVWNERLLNELKKDNTIDLLVYSLNQKQFIEEFKEKKQNVFFTLIPVLYIYLKVVKAFIDGLIKLKDIRQVLAIAPKIVRILRRLDWRNKYDFYFSHTIIETLILSYMVDWFKGSKLIIHEHGFGVIEYYNIRPKIVRYLLGRSDRLVVVTEFMKNICQQIIGDCGNIRVVPCGINIEKKSKPQEKKYITFCASLIPHKDPLTFIKSIPYIIKKNKDFQFVLIGKGELEKRLIDEVKKLNLDDYVIFTGEISNKVVQQYFYESKVFVLPSIREPFGIVLIEAMSNYTPCVITNVGGMPEVVDDAVGRVVQKRSPEKLAQAIIDIIEDEEQYNIMAINAYNKSFNYDMNEVYQKFKNCIFD